MHFDLSQWKVNDIARFIVLLPTEHVPARKFWRKRDQKLKASDKQAIIHSKAQYKPQMGDLKALSLAKADGRWKVHFEETAEEFPRIGLIQGPLRQDGSFFTPEKIWHPLGFERQREPFQGLYSRLEHDYDVEKLEYVRAIARENFILGQRGEGPYVDGLVYARVDHLLEAEIAHCDARLRFTRFILSQRQAAKPISNNKPENWVALPGAADERIAKQYEHAGFRIRKIETTSKQWYEVLHQ